MSYSWMITFDDITDEVVKAQGDTWLSAHPSATKNYYDIVAQDTINFAGTYGHTTSMLNAFNRTTLPLHSSIIQWMITDMSMQVAKNLIGVNNDPMVGDKWKSKYSVYREELKAQAQTITYEMFLTPEMQMNYTRVGGTVELVF